MANPNILDPGALTGPATEEENVRVSDPSFWDYVSDAGKSLAQGFLRTGPESVVAAGGDTYDLAANTDILARKWGGATPEETAAQHQSYDADRLLPNSQEVSEATSQYIGEPYKPRTGVGRFLETAGATVSSGGTHLLRDIVAPYLGSEVGEKVGEAVGGDEGAAVFSTVGGAGGSALDESAKRVATRVIRGPLDPARADRFRTLQREGVDAVTGGQASGSKALQYLETGPYENKARSIALQQARQYTRAALRRAGIDSDVADPATMFDAQQQFGAEYENLVRQNNGVVMDPTFETALLDIGSRYERLKGSARDAVGHYFDRITAAANQHGGVIPPDVFQEIHSEISADRRRAANSPELAALNDALGEFQDAMYDNVGRNSSPAVAATSRDLNNRYRNFKIIEKSVGGAGEGVSFGYVSPGKLRAELERRDPSAYAQGQGDLAELARAGQSLADIPNSGTGGRAAPLIAAGAVGTGIQQLLSGNTLAGAATIGGTAATFAAPSILTSRPVRTSIVRRVGGENQDFFNPMALTPYLDQDNQPAPVEPPAEPDEQSMLLDSDVMPAPVDPNLLDPRARAILQNRGLA